MVQLCMQEPFEACDCMLGPCFPFEDLPAPHSLMLCRQIDQFMAAWLKAGCAAESSPSILQQMINASNLMTLGTGAGTPLEGRSGPNMQPQGSSGSGSMHAGIAAYRALVWQ